MITQDNLAELLRFLDFSENNGIFKKEYNHGASIEVNFNTLKITYAPIDTSFKGKEGKNKFPSKGQPSKGFVIHRDTTLNFKQNESFVCLVCIHLLLIKGYEPKHIVLEPEFDLGHAVKPSFGDILVFDKEYNPLVLIENKTYGSEFSKEWNKMQKDGGQLFSYLGTLVRDFGLCDSLVLFAADFEDRLIPKSHIITLKDSEKRIAELENPKTFKNTQGKFFDVWSETYAKSFETKGLFEKDVEPYTIGKLKYTINDLEVLSHAEIRPIYHDFATILRNHAITDFEHSFYILIDLFLCKITDERNNPDDLQFLYKGITRDTPKEYCARLLNLYQQGKKDLFGVDVINKNESDIAQIFEEKQRTKNGLYDGIKELFEEIKFYNIKKFNFIDVENKEDFELNFQILIEVTSLIQDIRLSDSETNHFFGDLFEGLLSKNVHQTEGQFFTPLPIVNFIIKSLPEFPNKESIKVLDYACGAGHFLTEFLKAYPRTHAYGIEKSQPLSQVAKIATIINGAKDSHIVFKDALSIFNTQEVRYQGFDKEGFDCLIANPPYSVDGFLNTLTEKDRNCFSLVKLIDEKSYGSNGNIQCFFIERATHFLKKNGLMAIVLPVSILSNNDSLFKKTRELIFANFNILSIVGLNNRTFGSTGTNTIILFAQKVTKNSEGLLNSFIHKREFKSYLNHEAIDVYIEKQGYNKEEYLTLMQDSVLQDGLITNEIFSEYERKFKPKAISKSIQKQWFKESSIYIADKKENSREHRELFAKYIESEEYKQKEKDEYHNQFVLFVREIERDKLNAFIQIYDNNVAILQSPPDKIGNKSNKEQVIKFLGYDWSSRKNDEGIKYITNKPIEDSGEEKKKKNDKDSEILEAINSIKYIDTPLYNPNNAWDNSKFAFAIRKHIYEVSKKLSFDNKNGEFSDAEFNGGMDDLLSYSMLSDLIKFDRGDFDLSIQLRPDKKIVVESKYPLRKLRDIAEVKKGKSLTSSQAKDGNIKVVAGGIDFAFMHNESNRPANTITISASGANAGYVNYWREPIFASDCTTVRGNNDINTRFLYNFLLSIQEQIYYLQKGSAQPHVYPKDLELIMVPELDENLQIQIVEECEKVDEEYNTSRMSIENYRKKIAEVFERLEVISKVGGG